MGGYGTRSPGARTPACSLKIALRYLTVQGRRSKLRIRLVLFVEFLVLKLTRKGEYAIRSMIFLAQQDPEKICLMNDIAEGTEVPRTFLAKILQGFARLDLVQSQRGCGGGFSLARPADQITLREVVEAVEGPIIPNQCLGSPDFCSHSSNCRTHLVWKKVQDQVKHTLDGVTLSELTP